MASILRVFRTRHLFDQITQAINTSDVFHNKRRLKIIKKQKFISCW